MVKLEIWQAVLLWAAIAGAYLGWRYFLKPKKPSPSSRRRK